MRTIQRDIVGAVIESADGKILLAKSRKGGVYQNCHLIPGGGIDEGETREQAVEREVKEETGIDISNQSVTLISEHRTGQSEKTLKETGENVLVNMHFNDFHIRLDRPAADIVIQENDDVFACQWFEKSELGQLKLSPPTEELFKQERFI